MKDLRINDQLTIPAADLRATAVRSSGPGGQHVNKVATKVVLTFDLPGCAVLTQAVKKRLRQAAGRRVDRTGLLRVMSQRHRTREQNLEECRQRICRLIRGVLTAPRRRRRTHPPAWAAEQRLDAKRRTSRQKELRRPPGEDS